MRHRTATPSAKPTATATLVAVLAALLTACGTASTSSTATGTWQAPSPAASPSPAALTVAQARARYMEIVTPYNTALAGFEAAAHAGQPWRSLCPLAGRVAGANKVQADELRTTAWPDVARAPMADLLAETDAAQVYWEQARDAKTSNDLADAVRGAAAHSGTAAANRVRAALGLPAFSHS